MIGKVLVILSKRQFFVCLAVLLQLVLSSEAWSEQPKSQVECKIKVGWGDWPPYQYLEKGKPSGLQIDLVKQIGKFANCNLQFIPQNFKDNQLGIKNGSIDMTFDTSITPERSEFALFSKPYRNEVLALYVRPQFIEACQNKSIKDLILSGMRLGITRGNIYGEAIASIQSDALLDRKLIYRNDNTEHYRLFADNQLDALVEDPAVMAFMKRNNPKTGYLKMCQISVSSSTVSLMFSKKTVNQKTVERFNQAIDKVKQTSAYIRDWGWE